AGAEIDHPPGTFTARGAFRHEADFLETAEPGAELDLRYEAAGVNLVLEPAGEAEILLDSAPVPPELRGTDLVEREGRTIAVWERARMVRLIDGDFGAHRLRVRFSEAGVRGYAFSFSSCG